MLDLLDCLLAGCCLLEFINSANLLLAVLCFCVWLGGRTNQLAIEHVASLSVVVSGLNVIRGVRNAVQCPPDTPRGSVDFQ